jgi:uncharacterized protein GlcG (DUF336 family)
MGLLDFFRARRHARNPWRSARRLELEQLESRTAPSVSATLGGGVLAITGGPGRQIIHVSFDSADAAVVVSDATGPVGVFSSVAVHSISILTADGGGVTTVDNAVLQPTAIQAGGGDQLIHTGRGPTTVVGGPGVDKIIAGSGPAKLIGGTGQNALYSGAAPDVLVGGPGRNEFFQVKPSDTVVSNPGDQVFFASLPDPPPDPAAAQLTALDVSHLLDRAAAADAAENAIVAIVDRGGNLLGVRVEGNVSPLVTANAATLTFAIDGALAEARTGAFFANNQAPLTSRTVSFISQSTITQREVNSSPDVGDPNSQLFGPGLVAPIRPGGHFPPGVANTPQVDLFEIELTNRDTSAFLNPDGTLTPLPSRFNVPTAFIPPGAALTPPDSYGFISGIDPTAQPRGIATLPGGIPIYKDGELVGGIGVFFPGTTGFASEENSSLSADFNPTKPDLSLAAEAIAFEAVGGAPGIGLGVGAIGGVAPVPGIAFPLTEDQQRIDLVGITLDIVGPGGLQGPARVLAVGASLGVGNPGSGVNEPIDRTGDLFGAGKPVPDGWLVTPHDGVGVSAAQVVQIIDQGIGQAELTRAAIRLPLGSRTRMVFAVTDETGAVLGLYRMPDATVFSIAVAVAKARNVAYYDGPQLQPIDQVPGLPPGVAMTARTFRYLAEPRFPEGIDGAPPGPFSILNDGGVDPTTGLQVGPPLPASAFQSVLGFVAFHPQANFRDPFNPLNQNGVVFFPGSSPLYVGNALQGGFGVSGDGVAQDDVMTFGGIVGFGPPPDILRADQVFVRGVRLPYIQFDRNPEG